MEKLLIIDDDRDTREALTELLKADGRLIMTATNGQEALEHLMHVPLPRLILLDLSMPIMDGWEFLRQLRSNRALSRIPTIVVSGGVSEVPDGATNLIGKPIDVEMLLAIVNQYC